MQLRRVTLAVEDVPTMVAFYNATFETDLRPTGDGTFASGTFLDVPLVLCPNAIAQVDARQARHQLRLEVDDARAVGRRATTAGGGVVEAAARPDGWLVVIEDPDGNTYELVDHQPTQDPRA